MLLTGSVNAGHSAVSISARPRFHHPYQTMAKVYLSRDLLVYIDSAEFVESEMSLVQTSRNLALKDGRGDLDKMKDHLRKGTALKVSSMTRSKAGADLGDTVLNTAIPVCARVCSYSYSYSISSWLRTWQQESCYCAYLPNSADIGQCYHTNSHQTTWCEPCIYDSHKG